MSNEAIFGEHVVKSMVSAAFDSVCSGHWFSFLIFALHHWWLNSYCGTVIVCIGSACSLHRYLVCIQFLWYLLAFILHMKIALPSQCSFEFHGSFSSQMCFDKFLFVSHSWHLPCVVKAAVIILWYLNSDCLGMWFVYQSNFLLWYFLYFVKWSGCIQRIVIAFVLWTSSPNFSGVVLLSKY